MRLIKLASSELLLHVHAGLLWWLTKTFFFLFFVLLKHWTHPGSITATVLNSYYTVFCFFLSLFACLYISRPLYLYSSLTAFVLDAFFPRLSLQTGFLCTCEEQATQREAPDTLQGCTETDEAWRRLTATNCTARVSECRNHSGKWWTRDTAPLWRRAFSYTTSCSPLEIGLFLWLKKTSVTPGRRCILLTRATHFNQYYSVEIRGCIHKDSQY